MSGPAATNTLVIGKIEDQGDRVLLFPNAPFGVRYVVATPPQKQTANLQIGDTIKYELDGITFGKFLEKVA